MRKRLLILGILVFLALAGMAGGTHAQSCTTDAEPNNDPASAQALVGCAAGTLADNDQDLYRFTVSPDQAGQAFTLALDGVPDALTKADLLRMRGTDRPQTLYSLTSPNGGEVQSGAFILSAGDYLIGVYGFGVGAYQVRLEPGDKPPASGDREPNDRQEQATKVAGAFNLSGVLAGDADWYAWTLSAADAGLSWNITAQAAFERRLDFWLYDATGAQLARRGLDALGRTAFTGLNLAPGAYFLQLQGDGEANNAYRLTAIPAGAPAPGAEAEPNDIPERTNAWTLAAPVTGQLNGGNDTDVLRLTIDPAGADTRFDLRLRSDSRSRRTVCLRQPDGLTLQCREGLGEVSLPDLALSPGDYLLAITGDADPAEHYTLTSTVTGARAAGREDEPNDVYQAASPLDAQNRARGRFAGSDTDVYRLVATGKPQLWRIQVIGDGVDQVRVLNATGDVENSAAALSQRRLRLTNVFLLPGTHYIDVRGQNSDYRIMAISLGPPPEGVEREPNDTVGQANPLTFGAQRTGLLNEGTDADTYRFTLVTEEHIRLTVTPPDDGGVYVRVSWEDSLDIGRRRYGPSVSTPYVLDTTLQPGDYLVRLAADPASDSPYTILLERRDPFVPITDLEPNDAAELASPVPPALVLHGTADSANDDDWYALPRLAADTGLKISAPPAFTVSIYDGKGQSLTDLFQRDKATGAYTGALAASAPQPFILRVAGDGAYEVKLAFDKGPAPAPASARLPMDLAFRLADARVAAYWPVGQAVSGTLTLTNRGGQAVTLALDAHPSHYKIEARTDQTAVTVPAGGRTDVPVSLILAADLAAGEFPVTWRARAADGGQVTADAILTADPNAAPQAPRRVWPLPDSLLGGLNAASPALGAQIVTPDADLAQRQQVLHDGYTALQDVFRTEAARLPVALTVKLAGDAAAPVAGILLNPQSDGPAFEKLQDFELWLSDDGQQFTQALTGRLSSALIEQAFPLARPVLARYAQLRLLSNHAGNRGYVALGEWKVVAAPGVALGGPVNLAAQANGGTVVSFHPQIESPDDAASLLSQDGRAVRLTVPAGTPLDWVFGFLHGRAGQVTALQWANAPDVQPAERIAEVEVFTSLDSPTGPWTSLGRWKLGPAESTFTLPAPAWARYVRVAAPARGQNARLAVPDILRIIERPTGPDYRSVIGEWGHTSRSGAYEWLTPLPPAAAAVARSGNDAPERAQAVAAGASVQGTVQIGEKVDWYRIDVPAGQNAVVLRLTGQPTVGVRAIFQDAAGKPLPVTVEPVSPAEQVITATVTGGSTAYLRIEEPPRSVIFAWDTSGSMGSYFGTIYSALSSFIEGVTPGREGVNLLPFGGDLLLKTWSDEPAVLQKALNDYNRQDGSSNAEETLLKASQELAYREGSKTVVFITDAESNGYALTSKLWDALTIVKPRIFSLIISSHVDNGPAPANPPALMQTWAAVNGGYFDFLRTTGELDVTFARASAWLRRPAAYAFTAHTAALPPPGPGKLSVLSSLTGQDAAASAALLGNTAVEIIFDASGSMTQRLDKSTRIGVARDTLNNLIDNILPKGIPLALRAFGNREGNYSCRTDLEIPLAPLDPAAVKARVGAIQPQKLGGTPIAASLLKVSEDLKDAGPGPKLVILLTDGEESCKGDPGAAIAALRKQGYDVRLNIVGFTVTDKKLKDQMTSWASAGGGQFFPAADQKALTGALNQALRVPYRVLGDKGQVVAQGLVDGGSIQLPAGIYRIEVLTDPLKVLENVTVSSGKEMVVRVKGE